MFQNLQSLRSFFSFDSFSVSHANLEAQKIKLSRGLFRQIIDRSFLLFFLRKQGFAVTLAKLNDSYLLFKLKLLPNQSSNGKYLIFEDLCFQGIQECFPKTMRPWVVLVIPCQDGRMSVSLFYQGILLYKRELLQGCDLENEIVYSLQYLRKFDLPMVNISGLLITTEVRALPFIPNIPFKRVNASAEQLVEIGLKSKQKLVFKMPLTADYLWTSAQRILSKSLIYISIPMFLITSAALALHPYILSKQELLQTEKDTAQLEKSLIPSQIFSSITQSQTSIKPIMQVLKEHIDPHNMPSQLDLNIDKRELELTFGKPYLISKQLTQSLKDYKITKKSPYKILMNWKTP